MIELVTRLFFGMTTIVIYYHHVPYLKNETYVEGSHYHINEPKRIQYFIITCRFGVDTSIFRGSYVFKYIVRFIDIQEIVLDL